MDAHIKTPAGTGAMHLCQGDSHLTVHDNLEARYSDAFEQACGRLRAASNPVCTVDLSSIEYVCSACVGSLILLSGALEENGRRLTLRIPPTLEWYFGLFSMDAIATVEVNQAA